MHKLFTPEFAECLEAWLRYHDGFGWPFEGGWAQQPCLLYHVITRFEAMWRQHEASERDRDDAGQGGVG